jgi:hypothetical protein
MTEPLILDEAQYAVLRTLHQLGGQLRRIERAALLDTAAATFAFSRRRLSEALVELQRSRLLLADVSDRILVARGVSLRLEAEPGSIAAVREPDGSVQIVIPQI